MSGYAFYPGARDDLDEIWDYIAVDNLDAADRVIAEILDTIGAMVPFPNSGHRRPDLTSRPVRFIVVRQYLIAYVPDEKTVAGNRGYARASGSACDGRYSDSQGVKI
jgi:plasmid stabilization system protein ParE